MFADTGNGAMAAAPIRTSRRVVSLNMARALQSAPHLSGTAQGKRANRTPTRCRQPTVIAARSPRASVVYRPKTRILVSTKLKHAEEIIDGRHINRHVRIVFKRTRVGQIVPAASSQGLKTPVALDEFNYGGMVGISVNDMATLGVWRYHDERNARPISEEIEGLDETGIIISAAFIESHEDRGMLEQLWFGLHALDDVAGERLE